MSPFNAWVFLKGLETLRIRMTAHAQNALALAQWLEQQPNVLAVHYTGLKSHPQYEQTIEFCALYDAAAFDPSYENLPLSFFEPMLKRLFAQPRQSIYKAALESMSEHA